MSSREKSRILIVDDVPANLKAVAEILSSEDYEIFIANSGKKALERIHHGDFDLFLLDVMMPEMDGLTLCRKLKQKKRTRDIPVIFLTAKADEASIAEGFDAGAVDYVAKPFNRRELIRRVRTHLELGRTRRELEAANESKNRFFSIISHDLRGVVGDVFRVSEMLDEDFDHFSEEEMRVMIRLIRASSSNMHDLLRNLLQWSKTQLDRMEFLPEEIPVVHLAESVRSLFLESAANKDIEMSIHGDHAVRAFGDVNMVRTVLRNLLSNSIKFTKRSGSVDVSILHEKGRIKVSVKDTGIGMEKSVVEDLFRIDSRKSRRGTENEEGTGLGLILSKEFVERNGGTLSVKSSPGDGTEFVFTLPVAN